MGSTWLHKHCRAIKCNKDSQLTFPLFFEIRSEESYTETCNEVASLHGWTRKLVRYSEQHKNQQKVLILTVIFVTLLFECTYGKVRLLPLIQQGYFVLIVEESKTVFLQ